MQRNGDGEQYGQDVEEITWKHSNSRVTILS